MKQQSAFYPDTVLDRIRANARTTDWGAEACEAIAADASPWLGFSDDQLWEAMFGHTITRSWMVWSNGHCPACRGQTPMYTWEIDALERPWKVRCPHCRELFPKNDFGAYHASGLDGGGVFDPGRADRSLLYHADHPSPADPHRGFGVDDGEGYVEGGNRWRFIGAYLIYGQWKQLVLGGINRLSAAYVVSGEGRYAHAAGVLLDRVADLYPTFDFEREGLAYERSHSTGYVSTWHDACEESRELAEAYDRVYPALRDDEELVEYLSGRAARHGLTNAKRTWADVQRNIESGLLHEVLTNSGKIHSNYPRQENALLVIETVLGWPGNRARVHEMLDAILETATAVDGVTGEKGLAGYGTIGPQSVAQILGLFGRLEPGFLAQVFGRHPRLHDLYRFHMDTRCLGRYYPHIGDSGSFTSPVDRYAGVPFARQASLAPSSFSFMMEMCRLTGDPAFAQVLLEGNEGETAGLPWDLFAEDPEAYQQQVKDVVEAHGPTPEPRDRDFREWHIAVLRTGAGARRRALWLHYDAGGRHSHRDGLNLGLFAHGMDMLPEFGYPPVQFGGWGSPKAEWYKMTAGHNTVVVDGTDQVDGAGRTTLWAKGNHIRGVRAEAPNLYGIDQYQRTALMVDVNAEHSYVVDVFRVRGGSDHAKFVHSGFGSAAVRGLDLGEAAEYGQGAQMRNYRGSQSAPVGWIADWQLEDRHGVLPAAGYPDETIAGLRYIDLTEDASACVAEAWISLGYDAENRGDWIPRLLIRRQGDHPLRSTFVAVLAPHGGACPVVSARRLPLTSGDSSPCADSHVALEVELTDGRRDLVVLLDPDQDPGHVVQKEWGTSLDGEVGWVRSRIGDRGPAGAPQAMALMNGERLECAGQVIAADADTALRESTS